MSGPAFQLWLSEVVNNRCNQPLPVIVEVAGKLVVDLLGSGHVSRVAGGLRKGVTRNEGKSLILGKTLERLGAYSAIKIRRITCILY